MDVLEAIDEVRKGTVRPVYVFVGDETFLIDRAVKMLRAATVGEGIAGFNEDVFHGAKGLDGNKIVSAATTLPMMADKRFILVRHAEAMNADAHAPLVGYFKDPNPSTCFVVTADKIPGNTKFGRAAKAHRFDAKRLKGHQLEKLAVTESKSRGHAIAPSAARSIVDAVGEDLAAIDDALERLSLYVGPEGRIDQTAVDTCITRVPSDSIWALVDAVSGRDAGRATKAANALLANREPALRIVFMLARQLRMVAKMREALAKGASDADAARAAGAPPFKARELRLAAKQFSLPKLTSAFTTIAEADMLLKGSKAPDDVILLDTVLRLCR